MKVDYTSTRRKITAMLKYWQDAGFGWYKIDAVWVADRSNDCRDCAAETRVNWEYRQGSIAFYLPVLANMNDEELEHVVVHELSHFLTEPMRHNGLDRCILELTTEGVAKAILWARDLKKRPKWR